MKKYILILKEIFYKIFALSVKVTKSRRYNSTNGCIQLVRLQWLYFSGNVENHVAQDLIPVLLSLDADSNRTGIINIAYQ